MKTLRCSEKLQKKLTSTRWDKIFFVKEMKTVIVMSNYGNTTCQHALVYDAGSVDERGVAGHDHPIGWNNDDIAGHKLC